MNKLIFLYFRLKTPILLPLQHNQNCQAIPVTVKFSKNLDSIIQSIPLHFKFLYTWKVNSTPSGS